MKRIDWRDRMLIPPVMDQGIESMFVDANNMPTNIGASTGPKLWSTFVTPPRRRLLIARSGAARCGLLMVFRGKHAGDDAELKATYQRAVAG